MGNRPGRQARCDEYRHHQKWLGETLASIATEKAGIIKPGTPVITAADEPEALAVIEATARQHSAPLTVVPPSETERAPLNHIQLPLLGRHQRLNAAVALATLRTLARRIPVSEEAIRVGLGRVEWPGRLQLVTTPSGKALLLDGAHNVAGARILAAALSEYFPSTRPTLILGVLQDKDWAGMCDIVAPLAQRILLVPVQSERSAAPRDLAGACRRANPAAEIREYSSLSEALAETDRDEFVTVAGSLYLVGEAMELLELLPAASHQERGLNEWTGAGPAAELTLSTKR
ncbi:MAG: hypothetical protein DME25_14750 [Verrucomicrobia bacterium]|nr:MAG: hypothetical protein DME25_14750 [Verrucomicrobiota bacterium]